MEPHKKITEEEKKKKKKKKKRNARWGRVYDAHPSITGKDLDADHIGK